MKRRNLVEALFFELDGSLNMSQLFVLLMGLSGCFGFIWQLLKCKNTLEVISGWTFLGGAFASVLIASVPIAKAKILANAKMPGEVAKAIGDVGRNVETSTDVQELWEKKQHPPADEIG